MNDPQRPFWLDGRWHYYYLFNADYPEGNGTEWYHATSTDLVHWRDEGVAIDKYENGLGDIETGSAVIDVENTAGFGAGAVIAVVTQQHEGVQRQSLFVSTDGGFRFEPIDGNPVLDNPGVRDFRDPKIVWDEARRTWIMVLAEGSKLGFYTSSDLRDWTYRSGFDRDDLGLLETPDLFRISVDGDPANTRWVLMAGAHGDLDRDGMSTGTAYWTGDWNGERFTADRDEPAWLDRGADLYATVTWDDSRLAPAERLERRYAIGWLNNWAYAGDLPTEDWQGGAASVVREISLRTIDGVPTLTSAPIETLAELEGAPARATDVVVREAPDVSAAGTRAETVSALPQPTSDAYRLRVELAATEAERGEARIRVKEGGGHFATVGVDFATNRVFIARDADTAASAMPSVYREVRWANVAPRDGVVTLDVIVDAASVEVFANDGEAVLSSVMFPSPGANGLSAEAVGGDIRFRSFEISPLAVAPVERLD
ncbi:levanase [Agromyces aureus]|uniref:Levanase n=2 Tax=Agromyces aureus TaxID=453304 RepID=A0A191WK68_9MICO|nr:levanase [Agromyces aureus]